MYCAIFRDICYSTGLTVSESHRGPGKVLGVEEVEGGLALNLGGDVARHGGDPVVSVDDAAIREVAGQVLVLDSLDQAQLCDGPGEKMTSSSLVQCHLRVIFCKPPLVLDVGMTLSPLSNKCHYSHLSRTGRITPTNTAMLERLELWPTRCMCWYWGRSPRLRGFSFTRM